MQNASKTRGSLFMALMAHIWRELPARRGLSIGKQCDEPDRHHGRGYDHDAIPVGLLPARSVHGQECQQGLCWKPRHDNTIAANAAGVFDPDQDLWVSCASTAAIGRRASAFADQLLDTALKLALLLFAAA